MLLLSLIPCLLPLIPWLLAQPSELHLVGKDGEPGPLLVAALRLMEEKQQLVEEMVKEEERLEQDKLGKMLIEENVTRDEEKTEIFVEKKKSLEQEKEVKLANGLFKENLFLTKQTGMEVIKLVEENKGLEKEKVIEIVGKVPVLEQDLNIEKEELTLPVTNKPNKDKSKKEIIVSKSTEVVEVSKEKKPEVGVEVVEKLIQQEQRTIVEDSKATKKTPTKPVIPLSKEEKEAIRRQVLKRRNPLLKRPEVKKPWKRIVPRTEKPNGVFTDSEDSTTRESVTEVTTEKVGRHLSKEEEEEVNRKRIMKRRNPLLKRPEVKKKWKRIVPRAKLQEVVKSTENVTREVIKSNFQLPTSTRQLRSRIAARDNLESTRAFKMNLQRTRNPLRDLQRRKKYIKAEDLAVQAIHRPAIERRRRVRAKTNINEVPETRKTSNMSLHGNLHQDKVQMVKSKHIQPSLIILEQESGNNTFSPGTHTVGTSQPLSVREKVSDDEPHAVTKPPVVTSEAPVVSQDEMLDTVQTTEEAALDTFTNREAELYTSTETLKDTTTSSSKATETRLDMLVKTSDVPATSAKTHETESSEVDDLLLMPVIRTEALIPSVVITSSIFMPSTVDHLVL